MFLLKIEIKFYNKNILNKNTLKISNIQAAIFEDKFCTFTKRHNIFNIYQQ